MISLPRFAGRCRWLLFCATFRLLIGTTAALWSAGSYSHGACLSVKDRIG